MAEKRKEKNVILFVFQYQEDTIRPELSSPARFRILGGTLSVTEDKQTEILVPNKQFLKYSCYKLQKADILTLYPCYIQDQKIRPATRAYFQVLGRALAKAFLPFGHKKELIMLFRSIFGYFCCPVVTLETFSSNESKNSKTRKNKSFKNPKKSPLKTPKI